MSFQMLQHAIGSGLFVYILLTVLLGRSSRKAQNQSMVLTALIFAYMVVFGHKLPSINAIKNFLDGNTTYNRH